MIYALQRVVDQHREDIDRYGIEVNAKAHTIIWNNVATRLKPYSSSAVCWRELRRIIAQAKKAEEASALRNQTSLLDDLS